MQNKVRVLVSLVNGDTAEHVLDARGNYDLSDSDDADNWASAVSISTVLDCLHGEDGWDSWEARTV
jgi:hypothetical protein